MNDKEISIIVVGSYYEGSVAWFVCKAFKDLNIQHIYFDNWEKAGGRDFLFNPAKNFTKRIINKFLWHLKVNLMNYKLINFCKKNNYHTILFLRSDFIKNYTFKALKKVGKKLIMWYYDPPFHSNEVPLYMIESLKYFDRCFVLDEYYLNKIKEILNEKVEILTLGCEPQIHKKISLSNEDLKTYRSDVVYIGNFMSVTSGREKLLAEVAEKFKDNFKIWGNGWEKSNFAEIKKCFTGKATYLEEMSKVYSASKIAITPIPDGAVNLIQSKIFEATACGVCVITPKVKCLSDYYKIGEEIVAYENENELIEKIKYYLNNTQERENIAKAGQKKACNNHTYTNSLKMLLSKVSNN